MHSEKPGNNSSFPTNSTLCLSSGLVWVDLLSVLVVSNTGRWETVTSSNTGSNSVNKRISPYVLIGSNLLDISICRYIGSTKDSSHSINIPDNLAVNGARDAVLQFEVHLGNCVLREDRCL
ncbi:hypothetical protein EYC80_007565 [Monilinia laxa]|uniref:Uncharacterized protein n=1 Tax=Monilinia laxa TaxID=61186 RepID=A0A5N6JWB9_MONLA|nr:hypothetical protein EYC80_007565 [Monilinia laxa]